MGKLYRVLSGLAHNDPIYTFQIAFTIVPDSQPGALIAQRTPRFRLQQSLFTYMFTVHAQTEWMYIIQYGCDAIKAASILNNGYNQLGMANTSNVRFWRASLDSSNG